MTTPRKKLFIASAILLTFSSLIFHRSLLLSIGDFLVLQDVLIKADVIHVIAGPDHRLDYALQLYRQGYGKHLFFTGSWCKEIQENHAWHNFRVAVAKGIPIEAISVDGNPIDSTYSEIMRLNDFLKNRSTPIDSVMIVSDPYHMRRVQWTSHRILDSHIQLIMAPVPFSQSTYRRDWWKDAKSAHFLWSEYQKQMYYLFRYQWTSGRIRKWISYFDRF